MTTENKPTWIAIDPESAMSKAVKAQYDAMKAARVEAAIARKAFEAAFAAEFTKDTPMPSGKALIYGYNFGNFVVAIGDSKAPSKAKKAAGSYKAAAGALLAAYTAGK